MSDAETQGAGNDASVKRPTGLDGAKSNDLVQNQSSAANSTANSKNDQIGDGSKPTSTLWQRLRSFRKASLVAEQSLDSDTAGTNDGASSRGHTTEALRKSARRLDLLENGGWSEPQARRMERVFMLYARKDATKTFMVDRKSLKFVLRDLQEPKVFVMYVGDLLDKQGVTHLDFDMFMDVMNLRFQVDQKDLMDSFEVLDSNGDGALDREEFMNALSLGNKGLPVDDIAKLFALLDENQDGSVTLMEFINLWNLTTKKEAFSSPK